jgi:hypothetical protein
LNKRLLPLIPAVLAAFCACGDNPAGPGYRKEIAVFGFLWTERPLSRDRAIAVTWTRPIDAYFDERSAAVEDAEVTLTDRTGGRAYTLAEDADRPGFFYNDSLIVRLRTAYSLAIQCEGRLVTAETVTPGPIGLDTPLSREEINTVASENLGYANPIRIECDSPDQMILVDLTCLEDFRNAEYIREFSANKTPEDQEEYDGGRNGPPRHTQLAVKYDDLVSELFGGEHVLFWYGFMLNFYGRHTLQVLAIDDNLNRYLSMENPVLSAGVQGGIGVLGSVSGEDFSLQVVKAVGE